MARRVFPDDRLAFGPARFGAPLTSLAGAVVTIYADAQGSTLADVADMNGLPLDLPQILVGDDGLTPLFQGPADGTDTLYARVGGGAPYAIYARADDRLDAIEATLTILGNLDPTAIASALQGLQDQINTLNLGSHAADLVAGGTDAFARGDHLEASARLPLVQGVTSTDAKSLKLVAGPGISLSLQYDDDGNATLTVTNAAPAGGGDTTAPTKPTNLTAGTPGQTSVTLTWTASVDNVGVAGYRVYLSDGATQVAASASTSVLVTGLTAGTQYTLLVKAFDAAGNVSDASDTVTFTTAAAADVTAPTVPTGLTVGTITASSVALSWSASTDAVGVAGYRVFAGSTQVATSTVTSVTVTGLTASTAYTFTVKAYDAAGNESAASTSAAATTSASGADVTAPTAPTGLTVGTVTSSSIALSWTASTDAVGVTGYNVYNAGGSVVSTVATTSATITGLTASTSYTFTVKAFDAAGNISTASSGVTQSTSAPPDTTPPTAPTAVTVGTITASSVALSWSASTDAVGVTGYKVYNAAGTEVASSATTSVTVSGLAAATAYSFTVKAFDAAGNLSTASSSVNATTSAATASPPGDVRNLAASAADGKVVLTADPPSTTGGAALDIYTVTASPGSASVTQTLTSSADALNVTVSGLTNGTTYTFTVKAHNTAGFSTGVTITCTPTGGGQAAGGWIAETVPNASGATTSIAVDSVNGIRYGGGDVSGAFIIRDPTNGKVNFWNHKGWTNSAGSYNPGLAKIAAIQPSADGSYALALKGTNGQGCLAWRPVGGKKWYTITTSYRGYIHAPIANVRPVGHKRICFIDANTALVWCYRDSDDKGGMVLVKRTADATQPSGYTWAVTEVKDFSGSSSFVADRRGTFIVQSSLSATCFYAAADITGRGDPDTSGVLPFPDQTAPGGSGVWVLRYNAGTGAITWTTGLDTAGGGPGNLAGVRCATQVFTEGGKDAFYLTNGLKDAQSGDQGVWRVEVADPTTGSPPTATWAQRNTGLTMSDDVTVIAGRRDTTAGKTYLMLGFNNPSTKYASTSYPRTAGTYTKTQFRNMDAGNATQSWEACTGPNNLALTGDGKAAKMLGTTLPNPLYQAKSSVANEGVGGNGAQTFDITLEQGATPADDIVWAAMEGSFWQATKPWDAVVNNVTWTSVAQGYGAVYVQDMAVSPSLPNFVCMGDLDRTFWWRYAAGGAHYSGQQAIVPSGNPDGEAVTITSGGRMLVAVQGNPNALWWSDTASSGLAATFSSVTMTGLTNALPGSLKQFAISGGNVVTLCAGSVGGVYVLRRRITKADGTELSAWDTIFTLPSKNLCRIVYHEGTNRVWMLNTTGIWKLDDVTKSAVVNADWDQIVTKTVSASTLYGRLALDKTTATTLYATWGAGQGLMQYTNCDTKTPGSKALTQAGLLTATSDVGCVAVDPTNGAIAAFLQDTDTNGPAFIVSTDNGATWSDVSDDTMRDAVDWASDILINGNNFYVAGNMATGIICGVTGGAAVVGMTNKLNAAQSTMEGSTPSPINGAGKFTTPANGTALFSTAYSKSGTQSLELTCSTGGAVSQATIGNANGVAVTAGTNISAMFSARLPTSATVRSLTPTLQFFDSAGTAMASSNITATAVALSNTAWTDFVLTGSVPAGAAKANIKWSVAAMTVGEKYYVDNVAIADGTWAASDWAAGA